MAFLILGNVEFLFLYVFDTFKSVLGKNINHILVEVSLIVKDMTHLVNCIINNFRIIPAVHGEPPVDEKWLEVFGIIDIIKKVWFLLKENTANYIENCHEIIFVVATNKLSVKS